ncbi:MAG: type I methionyl aminopeptidase [Anaerolineaceae bacterium]|nr:MAG: type I methionyl aminopeptidase [Anaerolineaceae bacterium]
MSEPIIKTPEEIAIMREAGRIVALAHEAMREAVAPGVSTLALDRIAAEVLADHGATPAFLGYPKPDAPPFPATITASINHELVHGIPDEKRILQEGDIISLDVGCHYEGFVGDAARTWPVGEVAPAAQRLIDATRDTLYAAIEEARAGRRVSFIARTTQGFAASRGYIVAKEYTGHGVGRKMHEPPAVPNWWPSGRWRRHPYHAADVVLQPGMTLAIEPMLIVGREYLVELDDGWTVVTRDGSLCAHWEHSIAVTEGDPLILTLP